MDYSDLAMAHFQNPRNVGEFDDGRSDVGTGLAAQKRCGDVVKVQVRLEGDRIAEVRFKAFGCAAAVAAGSLATELAEGLGADEACRWDDDLLADRLELPEAKRQCAALAVRALRRAVVDGRVRQPGLADESSRPSRPGCCSA